MSEARGLLPAERQNAAAPERRVASIMAIGFRTEALVPGQGELVSFPEQPAREDVGRLLESASEGIERTGHVVVIYPAWDSEPALARVKIVKSALETSRIATYATDLPPLAGAVLCALASAVSRHVSSAGVLLGGLPALEKELMIYAWLGSVTRLENPSPSLLQHAASLLPRSAFGISFWPEPSVKRLTTKDRTVPVPTTYRPMGLAVSPRDGGDSDWVFEVIAPRFGSPPVKSVDPTPQGAKWWGTGRLVEAVVYPIDVPVVARRVSQGLHIGLCSWCGEAIAAAECPFCGLSRFAVAGDGGRS